MALLNGQIFKATIVEKTSVIFGKGLDKKSNWVVKKTYSHNLGDSNYIDQIRVTPPNTTLPEAGMAPGVGGWGTTFLLGLPIFRAMLVSGRVKVRP